MLQLICVMTQCLAMILPALNVELLGGMELEQVWFILHILLIRLCSLCSYTSALEVKCRQENCNTVNKIEI